MHNIKSIRENSEHFKKKLESRNIKVNFKDLLDLDKKNRELIQKKEKLEQERKVISKKISNEIKLLEESQEKLKKKLTKF